MLVEMCGVDKVIPYARNPRKNNNAIPVVKASIKEFGFQQPIVVDKEYVIVVGHTRYEAAKQLGYTEVPVTVADKLTPQQIKAYRIADNKSAEYSEFDNELLILELQELQDANYDISVTAIDEEAINSIIKAKPYNDNLDHGSLSDEYIVPPFSVWDTKQGYWLDRKRMWNSIIQEYGETRENSLGNSEKVYGTFGNRHGTKITVAPNVSLLDPVVCEISNRWFNVKGGSAFDPFAGDTVFGHVCSYLKYQFTGIEIRQDQVDINKARAEKDDLTCKYICDDGRNIDKHIGVDTQDLLFSCPPYYDLEIYSDLAGDASNQNTYEEFLQILEETFTKSIKCLKQNRFAVVVCGDVRDKTGAYRNLPADITKIFIDNNMCLYNSIILLEPIGTAPIRAARILNTYRKIVKTHQNVLVFYKGDIKVHQDILVFYKGDIGAINSEYEELKGLTHLVVRMGLEDITDSLPE